MDGWTMASDYASARKVGVEEAEKRSRVWLESELGCACKVQTLELVDMVGTKQST